MHYKNHDFLINHYYNLQVPYSTENYTYIDGHKIAFLEQGSGSPIILLHGIPTNSLMWRNIIPQLAKTNRVIAPDLLNYGKSAKPKAQMCPLMRKAT